MGDKDDAPQGEAPRTEPAPVQGPQQEPAPEDEAAEEPFTDDAPAELARPAAPEPLGAAQAREAVRRKRFSIGAWVEKKTKRAVSRLYESRADDIEERARRAVGSAYRDQADDIQERAIQAMRFAISQEADRIKDAIEHAVQVKKREVRLSLLVLVIASLVYLLLYWLTRSDAPVG